MADTYNLDELAALEAAAIPGDWFARSTDDDMCMGAVYITTKPDNLDTLEDDGEQLSDKDPATIVAITLLQAPRYVMAPRWDENATLIATARNALPAMIRDLRELRADNAAMLEMLRRLEWSYPQTLHGEVWTSTGECPSCHNEKEDGHAPTCKLNALLKRTATGRG